jgi:hypothetical protein
MGLFNFDGMELEDAPEDVVPRCPGCQQALTRIWVKSQAVAGSGQRVLLCPHCHVWLGYATTRA